MLYERGKNIMKKRISMILSVLLTLILILTTAFTYPVKTKAAENTFSGTVSDKTTSDILYLSTSGGTMEIKIDSSTQVSGTKLILPGSSITASCYRGSDEYWHASTLTGTAKVGKVTIDANNKATVKGTIAKGTSINFATLLAISVLPVPVGPKSKIFVLSSSQDGFVIFL